jgi:hypothetical protein
MTEREVAAAAPHAEDSGPARRLTLAFLWTWVMFNYVYGDILHIFMILMSPELQRQLEGGALGGIPLDNRVTLAMAVAMELAIAMVFLSWKLPYRPNRLLNIAIGLLFTLIMGAILFASGRLPPLTGYTLYAAIEVAITLSIVLVAWRWRDSEAENQDQSGPGSAPS